MVRKTHSLLGRGVLGDGFCSLRNSVLGQFSGEEKTDSSLDFPRSDGGTLVVVSETGSLCSNPLEDIIHKAVHDGHSLARDTSIRVNLLQDLVDVNPVALLPPLPFLLVSLGDVLLGLTGLLRCLA